MPVGNVTLSVLDNQGSVVTVPSNSIQAVIGPSSAGTPNTPFATRSQATLVSQIGYGPLLEAAMFAINGGGNGLPGGSVIVCKTTNNTLGSLLGLSATPVLVASLTNGPPAHLTVTGGHNLFNGSLVTITGATGDTAINGTWVATVISPTVFSIPVTGSGSYNAGTGSVQFQGIIYSGTGTVVPTITLDATAGAFDKYYIQMTFVTGGTFGTAGISFTLSLDANRNTGPTIQLGTALTYTIPNTGVTFNFPTGDTVNAGEYIRATTTPPAWNDAGVLSAILAIQSSPFANTGWGGDTLILGAAAGADCTAINGYLNTLANGYLFTRALLATRDAHSPTAWCGTGETATAWATSIATDYSTVAASRCCVSAGDYNMPSATQAQAPACPDVTYRRNLAFALAARQVGIPPKRNAGRVRDGNLSNIVINSAVDPTDGFVYWDERLQGNTLTASRFCAAMTRIPNLPGYYIVEPNLMSSGGSQFSLLPQGNVIDIASSIFVQAAQQEINDDVRTNADGTIYINDAKTITTDILSPLTSDMVNTGEISGAVVTVDLTNNVAATNNVNVACTIDARGYLETVTATISLAPST